LGASAHVPSGRSRLLTETDPLAKCRRSWLDRQTRFATANSTAAALGEWHSTSAIVLSILIGLHVFAVFVHQVGFRDNLLRRML
jgi:cytochrome b561